MGARTLAYTIAALAPVWLLAFLGIQGRFFVSPWDSPEYGPEKNRDLLAYAEPVSFVQHNVASIQVRDRHTITQAAKIWIEGHRSGRLKTVRPIAADDNATGGVRQEIEIARRITINALLRLTRQARANQDYRSALTFLDLAAQVAEVARYGDAVAAGASANSLLHVLDELASVEPHVSPSAQDKIQEIRDRMTTNPAEIIHLAERVAALGHQSPYDTVDFGAKPDVQLVLNADNQLSQIRTELDADTFIAAQTFRVAWISENRLAERLGRQSLITAMRQSTTPNQPPHPRLRG